VGNIQLGDAHLLDFCYREPRFNGYVIGEVHVDCHDLIPNSRRDDFVDNMNKGIFYNLIEKKVGLPISKDIRLRSRLASTSASNLAVPEKKKEYPSCDHAGQPINRSISNTNAKPFAEEISYPTDVMSTLKDMCQDCPNLSILLTVLGQQGF